MSAAELRRRLTSRLKGSATLLPLLAALTLAAVGVLLDPAVGLVAARLVALSASAMLLAAVAGRFKTLLAPASGVLAAGVTLEAILRVAARPLTTQPLPLLVFTGCALAGALAVYFFRSRRTELPAVALSLTALGMIVATGFDTGFDAVAVLMAPGLAVLPALGAAALLVSSGSSNLSVRARFTTAGVAVAVAGAALMRQVALIGISGGADDTAKRLLLWLALGVPVFAVCALFPAALLRRDPLRLAAGALAFVALASGSFAATAPLRADPGAGLIRIGPANEPDLRISSGMVADIGAGPRPEFRGKGFYDCDDLNSRDCFITHYDDIAVRYGVATAVEDVVEKVKDNKGRTFPAHCHQVIHNLGQMAFELATQFADAAAIDPQVCGTGYTHGLWEQQFSKLGNEVMFSRTNVLCAELNMVTPWYLWTCSHILGHMLTTQLMGDPARALGYCETIEVPQAFSDCQAGGWMNFFQDDVVISRFRSSGSFEELFGVCYGASAGSKFFCYQELFPVIYAMISGVDYLAAQACLTYAEPSRGSGNPWEFDAQNYTDRCIQGLARAVAVSAFEDYRIIGPRCLSMPAPAQDPCLTSSASSVVLNTGSTTAGFELCKQVTDLGYREYCYFWTKHSRRLLANGPNNHNLPSAGEVRLPEGAYSPPGAPNVRFEDRADLSGVPGN